jgi:flagellar protein FliO/FliZ
MDIIDFARYFGALAMVLALVGFAALAAKRYGLAGLAKIGGGNAARRLAIVETMMVGAKHKLFLFKRDGVEHLVLIGPQGSTVIEGGITAPMLAQIHALHDAEDAA